MHLINYLKPRTFCASYFCLQRPTLDRKGLPDWYPFTYEHSLNKHNSDVSNKQKNVAEHISSYYRSYVLTSSVRKSINYVYTRYWTCQSIDELSATFSHALSAGGLRMKSLHSSSALTSKLFLRVFLTNKALTWAIYTISKQKSHLWDIFIVWWKNLKFKFHFDIWISLNSNLTSKNHI